MTEEEKYKPPETSAGDVGHAVVHDILNKMIPVNELLKLIWKSPLEKRYSKWMVTIVL